MIRIEGLRKQYIERLVIDNLNLHVDKGEVFGLLGPNGAGKTTTIRILTMLTKPSCGKVWIDGADIGDNPVTVKKSIGVVPQHVNLDPDLTVCENLELHGRLHHISSAERVRTTEYLLDYIEVKERKNDMTQTLSGGMKRRLMIARALMHSPKVLFLDEPTVGLDPQVRRRIWDLIRNLNSQGLTIMLTTHYIEEAEHVCDRVAIVDKGKLIALDMPKALCSSLGEYAVEWSADGATNCRFFPERRSAADFAAHLTSDAILRRTNLEDAFIELTGHKVIG